MLSISGLRGLIGSSLTPVVAARYGASVGQWFAQQKPGAHVVVGRDSRPSGQMIEAAVAAGLLATGCRVTRLGIATTPGVAIMIDHLGGDGGVVITASHNPIQWNGIKTLRRDGVAPPPAQAQQIIDRFKADDVRFVDVQGLAAMADNADVVAVHAQRVLQHVDIGAIRKKKLKVVLDSVHGAGGPETRALLEPLGVELVHLWGEPTGRFPHTPEPTEANLRDLAAAVREHGADVGFAQDPDADRVAIVDENGRYIGEEYSLVLAALHVLGRSGAQRGLTLAANLSTSRMIDDVAAPFGATVLRTPVGEANVAAVMQQHRSIMGGEGNGGVILPQVCFVRDSLAGIALVLDLLAARAQPLSAIVDSVARYAIVKDKLDLKPGMADGLADRLARQFAQQKVDRQDGVRIDWPDRWVHVRPSNTEPILRIIAEARREQDALQLVQAMRQVVTG
jgi:phosphomannomutase